MYQPASLKKGYSNTAFDKSVGFLKRAFKKCDLKIIHICNGNSNKGHFWSWHQTHSKSPFHALVKALLGLNNIKSKFPCIQKDRFSIFRLFKRNQFSLGVPHFKIDPALQGKAYILGSASKVKVTHIIFDRSF